jgi:hypothetical protein
MGHSELAVTMAEAGSIRPHPCLAIPKKDDFAFFFQYRVRRFVHVFQDLQIWLDPLIFWFGGDVVILFY